MNYCFYRSYAGFRTYLDRQKPGLIFVAWLFIYGCTSTPAIVKKPVRPRQDGPPDHAVDVTKIPDPVPKYEPKSKQGNSPSYVVYGKRYSVITHHRGFVEKGIASWYGKKFHGRKTANGEIYDMYAMTAAHKSLSLPSYVEVEHLGSGRKIVVRVNDRGPFVKGRIIDLSYTAAKKLGIVKSGTAQVEIRDITPAKSGQQVAAMAPQGPAKFYVQIGAFKNPVNANKLLSTIYGTGLPNTRVQPGKSDQDTLYRVQLGPIDSVGEAQHVIQRLGRLGISSTRLVTDSEGTVQ